MKVICVLFMAFVQLPTGDVAGQTPARPTIGPTGTAVIAGTLVADDASAQPIRRANVTLKGADGAAARSVTTDDAGRFLLRALPAGRYDLQATKAGWLTTASGAKRPGRPGTPILIGDGQQLTDITLRMVHGAAITGTVRDERGQPAVGIRIFPAPFATRNGERVLGGGNAASFNSLGRDLVTTDDTGTYRIYGLPPGDVLVYAQIMPSLNPAVPPWYFRQITPAEVARATQLVRQGGTVGSPAGMTGSSAAAMPPGPMVKLATTFYPGTTDPANATVITLAAGEERTGIDLTLHLIPTVRIEGTVTDASGTPQAGVGVTATSGVGRTAPAMGLSGFVMSGTDKVGHYRIPGIGPGNYTLMASNDKAWAQAEVTVSGQDLSVPLTLQPNLTIAGRVVFDGASPPPAAALIRVGLRATGVMASINALAFGGTVANGRFAFENRIVPGNYQLTFNGIPAGWYAKSAVARGQETLDAPLEIGPNDATSDWVVTFTDRPSELAGTLLDAAGRPAPEYFIVVFPADKAYWSSSRRIVQTRPGSDGSFSVKGLPTGEYLIATLTDVEPGEWQSPAFLEPLVQTATRVKVVEGTKTTQDLKITGGR